MTNSLSAFQKHCATLSAWAVAVIIIISSMVVVSILIVIIGDYNNNQLTYRSFAALAWLLPLPPCLLALNRLKNMLLQFTKGTVFTNSNADDLKFIGRNFALTILLMALLVPGIYSTILLGWSESQWIGIERSYAAAFFLSWIIWFCGWLLSEGAKIQAENESFV